LKVGILFESYLQGKINEHANDTILSFFGPVQKSSEKGNLTKTKKLDLL
jgi:hypothetical protein